MSSRRVIIGKARSKEEASFDQAKPIDIQESVRTVQIILDEARLAKTKKGSSEDEPLKQDGGYYSGTTTT